MNYGAKWAYWAPISAESTDLMPTYDTATAFEGINESNDAVSFTEASAYGDNNKVISIKEFSSGEIDAKVVDLQVDLAASILGADTDDEGGIAYGEEDDPPYGGYGFISYRMDTEKNKFYECIFYPKVKGEPQSKNYKTKEDGYTLEYDALKFEIFKAGNGKYKITKKFEEESDAQEYLAGLFDGTSVVPGADE